MPIIQHLLVDGYGVHVGKYSQRLKVTKNGETLAQAPLLHLESVTIANQGVSLSAEAVRECTERGIPIFFISGIGTPYASLYSSGLTGTIATRRAQLEAFHNGRGLRLALAFSLGKLQNQSSFLKYMGKYRKDTAPDVFRELRLRADEVLDQIIDLQRILGYPEVQQNCASAEDLRAEIMGIEGRAAERYWGAMRLVIPEKYAFPGRKGRGAKDPLNSALNYAYGILYGQVERCLILAGLDPYAGFLHADRPGKPSLTLDFIEEFRPVIVDRTIIGMANKNVNFEQEEDGLLTKETRRVIADKIIERMDSLASFENKRYLLRFIMQMQARHLATYVRGDRSEYLPFQMPW